MLTYLLLNLVMAMNIETKSIILCDSHLMEEIIVDNNGSKNTHWLLTGIDHFYKSTMELYVDTSTIHVNLQHVIYTCFCDGIDIYRYVYNYAWETKIICERKSYRLSKRLQISKFYDIFEWIIALLLIAIVQYIYIFLNWTQYLTKNNQQYSLE